MLYIYLLLLNFNITDNFYLFYGFNYTHLLYLHFIIILYYYYIILFIIIIHYLCFIAKIIINILLIQKPNSMLMMKIKYLTI